MSNLQVTKFNFYSSVFGFHAMVFDEILPLYFTAPTYAGGLGISLTEFAKALSFLGIAQLIFQFGVYPKMTYRFNVLVLCRASLFVFIPVYILFPELSLFKEWAGTQLLDAVGLSWTFRLGYLSILLVRSIANCMAFTGLGIMVSLNI